MKGFNITEKELKTAIDFFSHSSINALTDQATKINKSQPNFTAVVLTLEKYGLDRIKVEDLLESIFIVYYVQTELRNKIINQISFRQIMKNVKWFEEFIKFYKEEKEFGTSNLAEIKFLRDDIVINFAIKTLHDLFHDITKIPNEVLYGYFSLLKAIEIGAEKER